MLVMPANKVDMCSHLNSFLLLFIVYIEIFQRNWHIITDILCKSSRLSCDSDIKINNNKVTGITMNMSKLKMHIYFNTRIVLVAEVKTILSSAEIHPPIVFCKKLTSSHRRLWVG